MFFFLFAVGATEEFKTKIVVDMDEGLKGVSHGEDHGGGHVDGGLGFWGNLGGLKGWFEWMANEAISGIGESQGGFGVSWGGGGNMGGGGGGGNMGGWGGGGNMGGRGGGNMGGWGGGENEVAMGRGEYSGYGGGCGGGEYQMPHMRGGEQEGFENQGPWECP